MRINMLMPLSLRLALDAIAAMLLLAGLAYYGMDNAVHEWIGIGMFVLVALHNVFNRRWYGRVPQHRRAAGGMLNLASVGLLLAAMLVLLASSVLVSRSVFAFMGLEGGATVRRIHLVAAHWAVLVLAIHLGMRWSLVMQTVRVQARLGTPHPVRTAALRVVATAVALYGVHSSSTMVFGSKLFLIDVMDMWDFHNETATFFLNFASIMGLYIFLSHYAMQCMRSWGSGNGPIAPSGQKATE